MTNGGAHGQHSMIESSAQHTHQLFTSDEINCLRRTWQQCWQRDGAVVIGRRLVVAVAELNPMIAKYFEHRTSHVRMATQHNSNMSLSSAANIMRYFHLQSVSSNGLLQCRQANVHNEDKK
jgi:hypothetical protein